MKHTPHSNFQLTADEDGNIGIGSVTTRDGHTPTKENELECYSPTPLHLQPRQKQLHGR